MGNLYKKGVSQDELNRQFEEGMNLPKLLEQKDKIIEEMKKHIADRACPKKKGEYLYELSSRDFSDWMAVMKDPCEEYRSHNPERTF